MRELTTTPKKRNGKQGHVWRVIRGTVKIEVWKQLRLLPYSYVKLFKGFEIKGPFIIVNQNSRESVCVYFFYVDLIFEKNGYKLQK